MQIVGRWLLLSFLNGNYATVVHFAAINYALINPYHVSKSQTIPQVRVMKALFSYDGEQRSPLWAPLSIRTE